MIVVAKKFVLVFVLVSCMNEIHTTPRTKFSFKKTFLTPRETYEKRIAELDNCEVLERSNFSSDEEEVNKKPTFKSNQDSSKAVANAQIHLRFGESPDSRPPINKNEVYLELPSKTSKYKEEEKPKNPFLPPVYYHYPGYPPPYPYPVGCGFPYGQMHSSYHSYLPPGCYNPYHYHNPNLATCEQKHSTNSPGNKNCDCFKQNIFQVVKVKNENQPCPSSSTLKPKSSTPSPHQSTKASDVPSVYFFTRDECGNAPSSQEIKNQPVEELTDEHFALIDKFLDSESEEQEKEEKGEEREKEKEERAEAKESHLPQPSTTPSPCTTKRRYPHEPTTKCPEPTPKPTCPVKPTTEDQEPHVTPHHKRPTKSTKQPTSPSPHTYPTQTTSCLTNPPDHPSHDVVLSLVDQPPPCKDNNSGDCLKLSDNLTFVKVNLSEITNSTCNCSYVDQDDSEEDEGGKGNVQHDLDDLYGVQTSQPTYQQMFPYAPCSCPSCTNYNPWWPLGGPFYPPWHYKVPNPNFPLFEESCVSNPELYGIFQPLSPKLVKHDKGCRFYDLYGLGEEGSSGGCGSCGVPQGCSCSSGLNYIRELNDQ